MGFKFIICLRNSLSALALLLAATNSYAAFNTWSISANVGQVDADLQPYFSIGDQITGLMVVEERMAESNSLLRSVTNSNAVQFLQLNVGVHSFTGSDPSRNGIILIGDNTSNGDYFHLALATPISNTPDFNSPNSTTFNNLSMSFDDSTGNALSTNTLSLSSPPSSSLFGLTEFRLSFLKIVPTVDGYFQFINTTVIAPNLQLTLISPVPEPEAYIMLLTGLGAMGLMVRRRKVIANRFNNFRLL